MMDVDSTVWKGVHRQADRQALKQSRRNRARQADRADGAGWRFSKHTSWDEPYRQARLFFGRQN